MSLVWYLLIMHLAGVKDGRMAEITKESHLTTIQRVSTISLCTCITKCFITPQSVARAEAEKLSLSHLLITGFVMDVVCF